MERNEKGVQTLLSSIQLEKYEHLFKDVSFDTFINLTEQDLTTVGIDLEEDRLKLLKIIEPCHSGVNSIKTSSFNIKQTLLNTLRMLLYMQIDTIEMKKYLNKNKHLNRIDVLIEEGVPASSASRLFIGNINIALNKIEKLCKTMLNSCDNDKKKSSSCSKMVWLITAATLLTFVTGVVIRRKY